MNLAVAMAARRRIAGATGDPKALDEPQWRPFQLAFILLNLAGLVDRTHVDRETADLLFFPTGGGKTEAYLGLAAFVIAHRRLSGSGRARRRCRRHHALHAAPPHARPARPRRRRRVRARADAHRRQECR